mmetsp:Transcript_28774/g.81170  ORF Transcript_28774/g.81170 Transcript_28774/m.81170 type:complete len:240 (-) Transcript_28774:388-1107(-)
MESLTAWPYAAQSAVFTTCATVSGARIDEASCEAITSLIFANGLANSTSVKPDENSPMILAAAAIDVLEIERQVHNEKHAAAPATSIFWVDLIRAGDLLSNGRMPARYAMLSMHPGLLEATTYGFCVTIPYDNHEAPDMAMSAIGSGLRSFSDDVLMASYTALAGDRNRASDVMIPSLGATVSASAITFPIPKLSLVLLLFLRLDDGRVEREFVGCCQAVSSCRYSKCCVFLASKGFST